MSPNSLISTIHELIYEWQKNGLVHSSRTHQSFRKSDGMQEVTWGNDGFVFKGQIFSSLSEYCSLLENKQYSMLLTDGSFFQFSYTFKRNEVVKHRLCWYPSPIAFVESETSCSDFVSVILEKMGHCEMDSFRARSPIRFDYAPEQAKEDHSTVHMHLSEESCRIPVKTHLCLNKFMRFIVDNFYEDLKGNEKLYTFGSPWDGKDFLTEGQKSQLHMNLFEPIERD